jgi:hypothetical protein
MWKDISGAPFDRDLELAVIDHDGPHALVFPCLRVLGGWTHAETGRQIDVRPTLAVWSRPSLGPAFSDSAPSFELSLGSRQPRFKERPSFHMDCNNDPWRLLRVAASGPRRGLQL